MYANFKATWTTLTFLSQICSKRNLELEILKTNVGIRISIIEIPCAQIFRQNAQLWLFWPKFAQKWILGLEFQKINVGIRISILEIPFQLPWDTIYTNFQTKRTTLTFWAQISPKMDFGGLDSKSAPPTYLVSRFSIKMDSFEFFGLNLGKLPKYLW